MPCDPAGQVDQILGGGSTMPLAELMKPFSTVAVILTL